jgi:phosphoesterase RecJ-like protein
MSIDWPRFRETIGRYQRFVLISHIRPDCDALGSELGMAGVLEGLGKQVAIVNGQATPPNLAFIDPTQRIMALGEPKAAAAIESADCFMILDTSAWAQLGGMGEVLRNSTKPKLVLDHHVSQDDLGAEYFKDTKAEATGRLVAQAAKELGVPLTKEIAKPLLAAVATDTGWFRFSSTTGETFRTGAALVDAGAKPDELYRELYEQDSLARLRLIGRILARAESELNGRLIHTAVLREDFEATGALPSDTEDIVNLTLTVAGTEVAVIFVEQPDGRFKISFRSRSAVDCSKLAETFNGGGHKAAAGASVPGPYAEALPRVLDAIRKAMG